MITFEERNRIKICLCLAYVFVRKKIKEPSYKNLQIYESGSITVQSSDKRSKIESSRSQKQLKN